MQAKKQAGKEGDKAAKAEEDLAKQKEKASKAKAKELEEREGIDVGTAPFTVETLSLQPKVLRVRNFISRAEAAALRAAEALGRVVDWLASPSAPRHRRSRRLKTTPSPARPAAASTAARHAA